MVREAEEHAEADAEKKRLIELQNQVDALIHQTERSIDELGDKLSEEDKETLNAAIEPLKEVATSDDPDRIEAEMKLFQEKSGQIFGKLYEQAQGAAPADGPEGMDPSEDDDDVIDAEFEEKR